MAGDDVRVVLVYCLFFLVSVSDHVGKVSPAQTSSCRMAGKLRRQCAATKKEAWMDSWRARTSWMGSQYRLHRKPIQAG